MNLNKINDKQYLLSLLDDREKLDSVITQSRGYVLRLMDRFHFKPELNMLLSEDINIYSLNFIVKNYELTDKERPILRKYFNDDTLAIQKEVLDLQEIEEHLIELKQLPKNTVIPFGLFSKYIKQISKIQNDSDDSTMFEIGINSVKFFSLSEFLSLDYDFLYENKHLFNKIHKFFGNDDFQKLYKDIVFRHASIEKETVSINNFRNYHFKSSDGDFLRGLLSNEESYRLKDYNDMAKIVGFSKLINKIVFFEKFNDRSLIGFSLSETVKNKKLIQNVFLKSLRDTNDLVNKDCSLEQFKEIVDLNFVDRILKETSAYIYRSDPSDKILIKEKSLHLFNIFLNYIIDNFENSENMEKLSISFFVKEMLDSDKDIDDLCRSNTKKFFDKYFVELFNSKNIHNFIMNGSYYGLVNKNSLEFIDKVVLEKPSINLLYILLKYVDENKDNNSFPVKNIVTGAKSVVSDLMPKLDQESVISVAKYFNYELPTPLLFDGVAVNNGFDFNFLNYKEVNIIDLREDMQTLLFLVDKNFGNHVLEKNANLSVDVLYRILKHTSEDENILNFLIKYVDLHKDKLLENKDFVENVLRNPNGKKIIKLNDFEVNNNKYDNFIITAKIIMDWDMLNERDIERPEFVQQSRNACHRMSNEISWDFMDKKTDELIYKKEFKEIYLLHKNGFSFTHNKKFVNYINNLSYDDLLVNIDNKSFVNLLVDQVSYDGKTEIVFSKFSGRENVILTELLVPFFKKNTDVLVMFDKNSLDFVNEFAIKNMPLEIFYSYNFIPDQTYAKSYVNRTFTSEEVFKAYKNLERDGGFFSNVDANARYSNFLTSNFEDNEIEFLKLLKMAKKEDHKFYVILAHSDIFNDFANKGSDRKLSDQRNMEYFHSNFDLDIVLSGMKIILDDIKEFGDVQDGKVKFNKKVAESAIDRVIFNTYYDETDYSVGRDTKYYSDFSNEDSIKIIDLLFREAPLYLLGRNTVGCIHNISEHVGANIKSYITDDVNVVDHLVCPLAVTKPEYFVLEANKSGNRFNGYVDNMIGGLIDYCAVVGDNTSLDYLSYLIQQRQFFDKEVNYDYRYISMDNKFTSIINYLADDDGFLEKLKIHENHLFLENVLETKLATRKVRNKI